MNIRTISILGAAALALAGCKESADKATSAAKDTVGAAKDTANAAKDAVKAATSKPAGMANDEMKKADAKPAAAATSQPKGKAVENPTATPPDVAAAPKDATVTKSGLAYKKLRDGDGKTHPKATDKVQVHYSGWTTAGKNFDSSYSRQKPTSFGLNQVIKGWTEGVQLMTVGERARFWIPAELAYGENPGGGRPGGMLVFDIELLAIQ